VNEDLQKALDVLKNGGVILYPTDTVWGLGCDATNAAAIERIYQIKKRETSKRMLILMENPALLDRYVDDIPEIAWDLIEITTTPLTIVFSNARNLAPNLIADDGTIGIRFTREEFSKELIRRYRRPIVSSSANFSGMVTPQIFAEIDAEMIDAADYVVKYRQNETVSSQPSSIIKLDQGGRIEIIRK
jgi:L-threonylcarbamoyladenylate synthase